ncbi:MAG: phosphodiester glycosidase family protein [Candidatus Caenarcaniphilales bacterium]|nr:phosphodiester glycosidase family protein [Candidatus Caenarcaniphilales bacterium]
MHFLILFFLLILPAGVDARISDLEQETILPGLIHHHFVKTTAHGEAIINILEIEPTLGYRLKPALASPFSIWERSAITRIASREGAFAAINANYFTNAGIPIGALAIDREWITGPVLNRATLSIDSSGRAFFARPRVYGDIQIFTHPEATYPEQTIRITSINQPDALDREGISFYNHWWQDKILCGAGRACLLVDGHGMVRQRIAISDSSQPLYPTRQDYIVSARDDTKLGLVKVGGQLKIKWSSQPDWSSMSHAVGGGPFLLSKGQIVINETSEGFTNKSGIGGLAPRTAVGITPDGRIILLVADGRQKDSVGLSIRELAELLRDIGVVEAINLDGGGSSSMVINGKIVNSPSDKEGMRPVSTALLVFKPGFGKSQHYPGGP